MFLIITKVAIHDCYKCVLIIYIYSCINIYMHEYMYLLLLQIDLRTVLETYHDHNHFYLKFMKNRKKSMLL